MNRKEGQKKEEKKNETNSEKSFNLQKLAPLPPAFLHLFPYGLIAFHFQQKIARFD